MRKVLSQMIPASLIMVSILTLSNCTPSTSAANPAEEKKSEKSENVLVIKTQSPEVHSQKSYGKYMGQLIPVQQFEVPTEVMGILSEPLIKMGSSVKAGQTLSNVKSMSKDVGMNDYIIKSPIDGILGSWLKSEGQIVKPNEVITYIYNPSKFKITVNITENDRMLISEKNKSVVFKISSSTNQKPINAALKMTSMSTIMDSATMTYPTEFAIQNDKLHSLTPGSWVTIEMSYKEPEKILVSKSLVKITGEKAQIPVLSSDSKVNWIDVKLGDELPDGKIEILDGLQKDKKIILSESQQNLKQGQVVSVAKS